MSLLQTGLYLALAICLAGLAWRALRRRKAPPARQGETGARPRHAGRGLAATFLKDVLLLGRTGGQSLYRWLAHSLILVGFLYLLLFHALGDLLVVKFFPDYQPCLNPWQWLRNLAGLLVLLGLALAGLRRLALPRLRRLSRWRDWSFLALLAGLMLSGFFLEAGKVISPAVFQRMTQEYMDTQDAGEILALKAHWAHVQGVVFATPPPLDQKTLRLGAELSQQSCAICHSPTSSAFVSRGLARGLGPLAHSLNRLGAERIFWYLHVFLVLLGLAALPWSKALHLLATPANLLNRRGVRRSQAGEAKQLSWQACTNCGVCSLRCSVAPAYEVLGNPDILPSARLASLAKRAQVGLSPEAGSALEEGGRICTQCLRCTLLCPSGLDLQALWLAARPELPGLPHNLQGKNAAQRLLALAPSPAAEDLPVESLADRPETFGPCLQCTTCTSVCPVAALAGPSGPELDFGPQQIMNLLRMGLKDQAMSAGMTWSCTTCYQCQEHCPQGIPVADLLYELRNTAWSRLRRADNPTRRGES